MRATTVCVAALASACFSATVAAAAADDALGGQAPDLGRLSIEQLSNIDITSVSKRPEKLSEAPASVFVITAEDIRRSGAVTLPEVLRLAPNLEVARLNASSYTITARGFNAPETANKLQVLIDGRSVYSPLVSTIFWEELNVELDDVERIEVVSGPGGTLYGANAVNGVINIITRSAKDTIGNLVDVGGGNTDRQGLARSGVKLGQDAAVRVYATGFERKATSGVTTADRLNDPFSGMQGGFRLDGNLAHDAYTLQGDIYRNTTTTGPGMPASIDYKLSGGNALGRWTHTFDDGSAAQLQMYYSDEHRIEPAIQDLVDTYDVQAQHNLTWGAHRIVWGGEYRLMEEALLAAGPVNFRIPSKTLTEADIFGQDEIDLGHQLRLTVGLKLEDDTYGGLQPLPTGRLAWQAADNALVWAAVSRAIRTPSRIDRELQEMLGGIPVVAQSDFQPETLTAYELGFRGTPTQRTSISISTYYNVYDKLRTEPFTPGGVLGVLPLYLANGLNETSYGVEVWGTYRITDWWQLRPGFNWTHRNIQLDPGALDVSHAASAGQDPTVQAQLRSAMELSPSWELDIALRYVGPVKSETTSGNLVSDYAETDVRLGWHVSDRVELSLSGFNLLHDRHVEAFDPSSFPPRYISRSVYLDARVKF